MESIEWMIAGGVSMDEINKVLEKEKRANEMRSCYEKAMGYNPLPWNKMKRLEKFLLTKTEDEIKTFAAWSRKDFSTFTPAKARLYPDMVIDLWPQAFYVAEKPPSMYDILAKQIEEEKNGSAL